MLKKILVCSVVSMFVLGGAVVSSMATADKKGPAEIKMVGSKSKKPKPALFPHAKHQDELKIACAECHHGMADGKQVAYSDSLEIQKCETCHTGDALAGKKLGKLKLDTIKGAGHGNCLACHKKMAKSDPALKAKKIDKCAACHPKKKK
ncbi:MAG: cytochrome c3 family protein [Desulfobulbaceae bacterium]|nr:cytochrome c3 family protein [Desulfobulbaceae bacterium]